MCLLYLKFSDLLPETHYFMFGLNVCKTRKDTNNYTTKPVLSADPQTMSGTPLSLELTITERTAVNATGGVYIFHTQIFVLDYAGVETNKC